MEASSVTSDRSWLFLWGAKRLKMARILKSIRKYRSKQIRWRHLPHGRNTSRSCFRDTAVSLPPNFDNPSENVRPLGVVRRLLVVHGSDYDGEMKINPAADGGSVETLKIFLSPFFLQISRPDTEWSDRPPRQHCRTDSVRLSPDPVTRCRSHLSPRH